MPVSIWGGGWMSSLYSMEDHPLHPVDDDPELHAVKVDDDEAREQIAVLAEVGLLEVEALVQGK